MAKIESITTDILDLPTIRPHMLAMATIQSQTSVLLRITRDDGIQGLGEATTISGLAYGPESPEGIKLAIDTYFVPLLLGLDAERPAIAMRILEQHIVGNRFAKCAIETALLDGIGKAVNLPLAELLGGRCREKLPVAWTLASGDTNRDIAEAEAMLEAQRHKIFKLKIGRQSLAKDCAHVAAIARALQGRASIRVDVNQAWSRAQATTGIAHLEGVGVELVEQPISKNDLEGMAALAAKFTIAIMADEALSGTHSAYQYATHSAADVLAVKIAQSGGLSAARNVAAIADVAHLALYGGTMLEAGIGTAASAHLFSTFRALEWGTELFGPLLLTDEILAKPLTYENFSLTVPTGSGLGIDLDEDKVRHYSRSR